MNKFMNRFFFLPPLILKLPGFVLFCFIQQRELQPALGYSPFLTLSRCPLVLTVCELWLLSVPPPHPNIGVTSICFFYQSKKKKKKKIGFVQNKSFSAFRKRAWSTRFIQGKNPVWNTKMSQALVFVTSHKVNFIFRQCFWGRLQEGRKRKIDSEWLIASFYQAGPLWKSSEEMWRLNIFPELSNRKWHFEENQGNIYLQKPLYSSLPSVLIT